MTANMVCPDCGLTDGVSWNSLKPSSSFPLDDPLRQYVRERQRPVYQNEDGSLDFAALIEFVSFPVIGIKGHHFDLRLCNVGPGSSFSRVQPKPRHSLQLDHISGDRRDPDKGVAIFQNRPLPEQDIVQSVVMNFSSTQERAGYRAGEGLNKDWNERKVEAAERSNPVLGICGHDVDVALARWDDPQLVLLASFEIHEVPYAIASMSVAFTELMEILEKLAFLNEDNEVLEQYVSEYDVMWRNRRSNRGS